MAEFYLETRMVHMSAVGISGLLFFMRWIGLLCSHAWPKGDVRYLSYAIDTVLLTAALMLMWITQQNPVTQAWLTVKVLLLIGYIYLGVKAFRAEQTPSRLFMYGVGAITVYGFIISVAVAHHPLGLFFLLS